MAPAHTPVMSFSTGGLGPWLVLPSLEPSAGRGGGDSKYPPEGRFSRCSGQETGEVFLPIPGPWGCNPAKRPSSPHFPQSSANTPFCNSEQGRAAGSSFWDIFSVPVSLALAHKRNRYTHHFSHEIQAFPILDLRTSSRVKVSLTLGRRWLMGLGHPTGQGGAIWLVNLAPPEGMCVRTTERNWHLFDEDEWERKARRC